MQRKTWARTRCSRRWWRGRISSSGLFIARKARSTWASSLEARTTTCAERPSLLRLVRSNVEAVERGFVADGPLVASVLEAPVLDRELEVLGDLEAVDDPSCP